MKKVLLAVLLFVSFHSNAQEKNRTLSFSLTEGVNLEGKLITQLSTYLDYELNNGLTINSWTGASFGRDEWLSSVTTINRGKKNFTLGAGLMYNSGLNEKLFDEQNIYGIIRVKYMIKL